MKHRNRQALILMIAAAALCLILAVVCFVTDVRHTDEEVGLIPAHKQGVGQLTEESAASQSFRAEQNGLSAVTVMFSNYNKNNKIKSGTLTLRLTDEEGKELARESIECKPLKNNASVTLRLPAPLNGSKGKQYTLWAASDVTDANGVTLRMGPAGSLTDAVLTLADGKTDPENALYLTQVYTHQSHGWMAAVSFVFLAVCCAAGIPLLERREERA